MHAWTRNGSWESLPRDCIDCVFDVFVEPKNMSFSSTTFKFSSLVFCKLRSCKAGVVAFREKKWDNKNDMHRSCRSKVGCSPRSSSSWRQPWSWYLLGENPIGDEHETGWTLTKKISIKRHLCQTYYFKNLNQNIQKLIWTNKNTVISSRPNFETPGNLCCCWSQLQLPFGGRRGPERGKWMAMTLRVIHI